MRRLSVLIVSMLLVSHAQAYEFDPRQIYFGGGLSYNDDRNYDAVGFQIFAGMPIPLNLGKARLLGEVGYMDSGNFDGSRSSANGLWTTAVIEFPVAEKVKLIGRAGFDIGDDDGLMIGGGVGIPLSKTIEIRGEYVIRDNIDSLQANIVIRL